MNFVPQLEGRRAQAISEAIEMFFSRIGRRAGRALAVGACMLAAASLASPSTAYARHGNGAGVALGIIGGMLAVGAIAAATAPGYYAPPPAYYPYAPQAYGPPAYYYNQSPNYYGPQTYYGPQYYPGRY
jgi:hypothetical protein